MASLPGGFNPEEVPPDEFFLIPNGDYLAEIINSEVKPTNANNGGLVLKLTWSIKAGPRQGAQIFQNINFVNPNATAQTIGRQELKKITDAMGLGTITETSVLHGRPVLVGVGTEEPRDGYKARNKVTGVKPYQPGAPVQTTPPPAQQAAYSPPANNPPAQQGATPGRPWG